MQEQTRKMREMQENIQESGLGKHAGKYRLGETKTG
jgi:hypothetical protein